MTFEELKRIYNKCPNSENFGDSCWEFCAFRENGICELDKNEIRELCLSKLLSLNDETMAKEIVANYDDLSKLIKLAIKKEVPNEKKFNKAIYSGSFDPFTLGHLDIVKHASTIFDEVHIVIATNAKKKRTFSKISIAEAIRKTLEKEGLTNCKVVIYEGLVAEYCEKEDIFYSVRGLRDNMDFIYEEQISNINAEINPKLKTVYLRAERNVSSSMVRELSDYGKDVSKYVPEDIYKLFT